MFILEYLYYKAKMKSKQIIGSSAEKESVILIISQLFGVPLDFYQLFSYYYKLIKAFFPIIITIIYSMNPFFYQNYLYRQPLPFTWFQAPSNPPNDFYRFYGSTSLPAQPLNIPNKQLSKRDCQTKPEIIKVEESADHVQGQPNLLNEKNTKKNSKKGAKNNTDTKHTNILEKPKNKSNIKVKYFDPSKAPTITTDDYNQIVNQQKQNSYLQKIQQIPDTCLNLLDFPEEDSVPFIVFKYRRIKKKYRVYLKKKDNRQDDVREHSDSSLSDQDCQSSSAKDERQQQIQNGQIVKLLFHKDDKKVNAMQTKNKIENVSNKTKSNRQ